MSPKTMRLLGFAAVVFGILVIALAFHATHSPWDPAAGPVSRVIENHTMWLFLFGVISAIGGALAAALAHRD